ncbi:MAG: heavy metal-associated domain-containing protein [Coriobacteriia bacterium]|nr:heavy metal-associated domain-containing protein [Coriobacteriia bacterium]
MSLFSAKQTVTLSVLGMHCPKCVARVTEALEAADGVTSVQVSLEQENAVVEGRGLDAEALVAVVNELGFQASLA